jgi:hypothetical protein
MIKWVRLTSLTMGRDSEQPHLFDQGDLFLSADIYPQNLQ